jgi:hypothetical protein
MSDEVWRHVVGHAGYEVSDRGRVRSWKPIRRHAALPEAPRLLKLSVTAKGYLRVALVSHEGRFMAAVHRLVLTTFVGPPGPGMEACHSNGDRKDNRLVNLRWDTRKHNSADKILHGTWQGGENNGASRLTDDDVACIRAQRGFIWRRNLSEIYGVSADYISVLQRGKTTSRRDFAKVNRPPKVTRSDVADIRRRCRSGEKQKLVAKCYGITQSMVSMIVNHVTYAMVDVGGSP